MKKYIPNTLTLLNLFCGCSALIAIFNAQNTYVFWFLTIGLIADVLDGTAARLLKVSTPMGKELDSLADMVSFGVVPAAILYTLLGQSSAVGSMVSPAFIPWYLPAFVVALFAALRLAIFNLDSRQAQNFLGLPTPSTTMYAAGLLWIRHYEHPQLLFLATEPIFLWAAVIGLSVLMVSDIPMFSLKMKSLAWQGNEIRFVFALITILLAIWLGLTALSLVILTYIILNFIPYFYKKVLNTA